MWQGNIFSNENKVLRCATTKTNPEKLILSDRIFKDHILFDSIT